jgi:outer membrane protein OmpA-like peptidoglycan-associated protein
MKKLFAILMVSVLCFPAFAQDETVIEIQDQKGPYVTTGFWNNWFVSVGGGVQVYFGETDTYGNFGDRLAPALDISVGKWITPSMGLRLEYSGLKAKGWTDGELPYSHGSGDIKGYYSEKFNTMNLHGDLLWNASNAIGGERDDRLWNFVPYVGFGWARSESNGTHKNELAANIGLLHKIVLTDAFDIHVDMRSMLVNQRFAQTNGSKGLNVLGTVTVGVSYKINNTGFQRASDLIVIEDNTKYIQTIASLEQMLVQAEQKRVALQQKINEQKNEIAVAESVEATIPILPKLAIFFEIGKAKLTEKSIINLGYLADILKQYPDKRFLIFASADKQTGTPEFNKKLSQQRGEAVFDVLVKKYGVNPEQLNIEAVGGTQQKFDEPQLNRVVVIEDKD